MNFIIINGPNLNLLGKRETDIYGNIGFEEFLHQLRNQYNEHQIAYFQSNIEGELIDKIQETGFEYDGIILNAAAYSHTSVAIADAIKAIQSPVIEVHISNVFSREDYRQTMLTAASCVGSISGLGLYGYKMALDFLVHQKSSE
ncbi:MAG: type II 3-dehydroquinate dehydratase [Bacteroidetes bacterium]|nr:type II 3-dehydroquinate dehydratase [Bacteroidota bacterium]